MTRFPETPVPTLSVFVSPHEPVKLMPSGFPTILIAPVVGHTFHAFGIVTAPLDGPTIPHIAPPVLLTLIVPVPKELLLLKFKMPVKAFPLNPRLVPPA